MRRKANLPHQLRDIKPVIPSKVCFIAALPITSKPGSRLPLAGNLKLR
jgi:hypothetical protein